jgi:TRAP-type mannitol/chloroaromatic compound transport system permease small subunit
MNSRVMKIIKKAVSIIDKISDFIGISVSVLLPAMVMVLTYEVVARYIFDRPTIWAFETSVFMFGYCGLLSGAYVLKSNEHINVDILYSRLSFRGRSVLNVITKPLFFFFIVLVVIYGWKAAYITLISNEHSPSEWGPPVAHFELMIPIGAFLLLLQGLADWIRDIYRAITNKEIDW